MTLKLCSDYQHGSSKSCEDGNGADRFTDDRKDMSDLGLEVVQQISTAAGQ